MVGFSNIRLNGGLLRHFDATRHLNSEWRLLLPVVGFGAACALYVSSRGELPEIWQLASVGAVLLTVGYRYRLLSNVFFQTLIAFVLGSIATLFRVGSLDVKPLQSINFYDFTGEITKIEERADKPLRLTLQPSFVHEGDQIKGLVRVTFRGRDIPEMAIGSVVRMTARLGPSPGPITPGGYDFSRHAFFMGIAAEGFVVSEIDLLSGLPARGGLLSGIEEIRLSVADIIREQLPGESGTVAVAILVGYKHFLSRETSDAFRHTGLAHLMAISGLHVGLVAAAAFFVLELIVSAIPAIALRWAPRKPAAVAAWFVAGSYVVLSGTGVSTLRAYLMVSIALLAVLSDRRVFTIRSVVLAAAVILIIWPESIVRAGFQMSFAATAALVVVYDRTNRLGLMRDAGPSLPAKLVRLLGYSVLTTFIAELAIAPFALYHFQAASLVGIGANTVVMPIFSLVVMPFGLLSLIAMPFGVEAVPLAVTGTGLEVIIVIAQWFADLDFAVGYVPLPPSGFLVMATVLFLAYVVWQGRYQFVPLVGLVFLLPWMLTQPNNDILIDNEGRVIAAKIDDEASAYATIGGRRGGFRDDNWARYWGVDPDVEPTQLARQCDAYGCITTVGERYTIAYVKEMAAVRMACDRADLAIIPRRWRRYCRGKAIIVLKEDIANLGPLGINQKGSQLHWSRTIGTMPWQISSSFAAGKNYTSPLEAAEAPQF